MNIVRNFSLKQNIFDRYIRWLILLLGLTGLCLFSGNVYAKSGFQGQKYPYNESDQSQVTVNVTLSSDGMPLSSTGGVALSHRKVTVPYFDLGLYGLQDFYRYPTNETCDYIKEKGIIRRPTLLHLYIYMMERYYLGYPADKCGLGYGKDEIFQKERTDSVDYMNGETAYFTFNGSTGQGRKLLKLSGTPMSLYMENFWGHDENLNYYVNHEFPVIWTDWGASADYILLEDGDVVDVAMFTDVNFYQKGGFTFFSQDDYQLSEGDTLKTRTYIQEGSISDGSGNFYTPEPSETEALDVKLYDENWNLEKELAYDSAGYITVTFDKPGVWYLQAEEEAMAGKNGASVAPATAKVTVSKEGSSLSVKKLNLTTAGNKTQISVGENLQLITEILPSSAWMKSVRWQVSGTAAYVDYLGILHAKDYLDKDQSVTVTARSRADRSIQASIQILIKADEETVAKVKNVENLIDAIGSSERDIRYTEECNNKILAARRAYDNLGKGTVASINVNSEKVEFLKRAELTYAKLKENAEKITPTPSLTPEAKPTVTATPKPAKARVKQTAASSGAVKISWTADKNADSYRIYIKGDKFRSYTKAAEVKKSATTAVIRKAGNKSLLPAKTYTLRVVSLYKKGNKVTEGRPLVLDKVVTCPSTPKITSVKKVKNGTLCIRWKKVSGASEYEVQMSTKKKTGFKTIRSVSAKTVAVKKTGLKKGRNYYFRIRSFRTVNGKKYYSSWSKTVRGRS